ncbi:ABC transporter ATP-binding protein [Paraburkholderia jirisanensis]
MTPDLECAFAVEVDHVDKIYRTYASPRQRLLELVSGAQRRYAHETHALSQVTFSLAKGARLGIVGSNGSGKSTLLKLLAGVLTPSAGHVRVRGRVSALLELGAGFNPALSGRENIRQFCELHNMRKGEIDAATPDIIGFSELQNAIEHPLKTYSSGMAVRLGFACAVYVRPDILIVDEALSVGDAYFQNKCLHKIRAMLDDGISFIYVTHSADAIRSLCTRGLWLDGGIARLQGAASDVSAAYERDTFSRLTQIRRDSGAMRDTDAPTRVQPDDERSLHADAPAAVAIHSSARIKSPHKLAFADRVAPLRTGTGEIRIDDIGIVDSNGEDTDSVPMDLPIRVRVSFHVVSPPTEPCALSLAITDQTGRQIIYFNAIVHDADVAQATPQIEHMVEFSFDNPLCPGEYGLVSGITVQAPAGVSPGRNVIVQVIDHCAGGARFTVRFPPHDDKRDLWGIVHVPCTVRMVSLD